MSHTAFLQILFLLVAVSARAAPTEELVADIRERYNAIEKASLKSDTIECAPGDDPMAGTMKRYFRDGELVKINLSYSMGEHGDSDETYYYHDGRVFFVFVSDSRWSFTGRTFRSGGSETRDFLREHRMYFADGRLIRYLRKTAETTDYDERAKVIASAKNEEFSDPEFTSMVKKRGVDALSVSSPSQLEKLLRPEQG